jgi:hypothetical protein
MPLRRRPFDREIEFAIRGIYRGLERSMGCLNTELLRRSRAVTSERSPVRSRALG